MSQNDFVIANASGASVRADINSALQALASVSAGATAPSTTYQYQWWFDTTLNILKIRDGANTSWINVASLVGTTWKLYEQGTLLLARANTWSAEQTNLNGVRLGLARGHIDGLILSNNGSDATNDIDVAPGQAADGANSDDLVVASAIGKQLDTTWASGGTPGTPTGGLSSSLTPVQNDTWYHVFLGKVSGTEEVGFDTSVTGANLVTDHSFTNLRRIGSVLRGTAANPAFTQDGDGFWWVDRVTDYSSSTPGTTAVLTAMSVPTGLKVLWHGAHLITAGALVNSLISSPDQSDQVPSITLNDTSVSGNVTESSTNLSRLTDTSSRIRRRATANPTDYVIDTLGWTDPRGKNS